MGNGRTKHVKAEQNKKKKIRAFWVMASRMPEQVCVRMCSACVCRLDHAYVDTDPETLINTEIE